MLWKILSMSYFHWVWGFLFNWILGDFNCEYWTQFCTFLSCICWLVMIKIYVEDIWLVCLLSTCDIFYLHLQIATDNKWSQSGKYLLIAMFFPTFQNKNLFTRILGLSKYDMMRHASPLKLRDWGRIFPCSFEKIWYFSCVIATQGPA